MPINDLDVIQYTQRSPLEVAIQPAHIALQSLMLLSKADDLSGLGDWVTQTVHSMTEEEIQANNLIMWGFYYLVMPKRNWSSFPAYIDHLASLSPKALLQRMMERYESLPPCDAAKPVDVKMDFKTALTSPDNYIEYLRQRFDEESVDEEIENRVYHHLLNPPVMRQFIVEHLWKMWRKYLKEEWENTRPTLQEVVRAYQQEDLQKLSLRQALPLITGRELPEKWEYLEEEAQHIIFSPHPHVGPYLVKAMREPDTLIIFFYPRLPVGMDGEAHELSRAEIVIRLSALADDTRLRILRIIAERGEIRSQDVITELDLSQSAASRHLTQLSATGYITERRCEGAKCYALNPARINDTLQAIGNFLMVSERSQI